MALNLKPWLCHLLAACLWVSNFMSQGLSAFICKKDDNPVFGVLLEFNDMITHQSAGLGWGGGGRVAALGPLGSAGPSPMLSPGGAVSIRKGGAQPISSQSFRVASSLPPGGNPVCRSSSGHPAFAVTPQ